MFAIQMKGHRKNACAFLYIELLECDKFLLCVDVEFIVVGAARI